MKTSICVLLAIVAVVNSVPFPQEAKESEPCLANGNACEVGDSCCSKECSAISKKCVTTLFLKIESLHQSDDTNSGLEVVPYQRNQETVDDKVKLQDENNGVPDDEYDLLPYQRNAEKEDEKEKQQAQKNAEKEGEKEKLQAQQNAEKEDEKEKLQGQQNAESEDGKQKQQAQNNGDPYYANEKQYRVIPNKVLIQDFLHKTITHNSLYNIHNKTGGVRIMNTSHTNSNHTVIDNSNHKHKH